MLKSLCSFEIDRLARYIDAKNIERACSRQHLMRPATVDSSTIASVGHFVGPLAWYFLRCDVARHPAASLLQASAREIFSLVALILKTFRSYLHTANANIHVAYVLRYCCIEPYHPRRDSATIWSTPTILGEAESQLWRLRISHQFSISWPA